MMRLLGMFYGCVKQVKRELYLQSAFWIFRQSQHDHGLLHAFFLAFLDSELG